jgi:uroporphyrinogen-III synthase
MPPPVLLLRAPSEPDLYHRELCARGYEPHSIRPLDTALVNQDELRARLGSAPAVRAAILTSARSAEAWRAAVVALHAAGADPHTLHAWHLLPLYVVGAATAAALTAPDADRPNLPLPLDIRGAAQAGTSERLAQFIVDDLAGAHGTMLYLVGDKNSDAVPKVLEKAAVRLDTLRVYETGGSPTFQSDLRTMLGVVGHRGKPPLVLQTHKPDHDADRWWIVFFAPSSSSYVLPFLQEHFAFSSTLSSTRLARPTGLPAAFVAAIGPTTDAHLADVLHLDVHAVSPRPSAHDLAAALQAHDDAR